MGIGPPPISSFITGEPRSRQLAHSINVQSLVHAAVMPRRAPSAALLAAWAVVAASEADLAAALAKEVALAHVFLAVLVDSVDSLAAEVAASQAVVDDLAASLA